MHGQVRVEGKGLEVVNRILKLSEFLVLGDEP